MYKQNIPLIPRNDSLVQNFQRDKPTSDSTQKKYPDIITQVDKEE